MPVPRIDVHAHCLPDFYIKVLNSVGEIHPDGMPAVPDWSTDSHREANMQRAVRRAARERNGRHPADPAVPP